MRRSSVALRTYWTLPLVLAGISACLFSAVPEAQAQGPNPEDPVQAGYLRRFSLGMPVDSLYYLLAGHALRGLAFDTAMAFNLSIPTPPAGAFRDSVLTQRYRLYVLSGLHDDAAALRDSLPRVHRAARLGRRAEWEVKAFSGYGREDQAPARVYPAGFELEGIRSEGWLARHQAGVTLPLPSPPVSELSLGLGYDLAKSYYKDSLDYRAEALLKADRILDRLSAAVSAEGGRITGVGSVAALKAEVTFLFLGGGGFLIANAGYESEWESFESRRYDATWITVHREWGAAAGRAFHLSGSATWLRTDPLKLPGSHPVIYIEDAGQEAPVHYTDGTYRDTIRSSRFTAYQVYTDATGGLEFRCPQNALTLSPSAGLNFQAGWGMMASLTAGYAWSWYPSPYRWLEQTGGDPFAGDASTFHGFARSRLDGRYFPAYLDNSEGPLREAYGSEPLAEREATRMDHRLQAGFGLKRKLAGMGSLALDFGLQRTFPGLEGKSPLWAPEWEIDAAVRWTLSGAFR